MFQIGGKNYEVLQDHKNGWNPEAFRDRYSEVLDRYDYIIGDWGYNQLRLKGFYREGHPKANKDTSIVVLDDYINEYCNFGCAYFVLQKSREVFNKNGSNDESIAPDIQQLVDAQKEQAETLETEEQQEILQHTAVEREWTQSQQDSTIMEEPPTEQSREVREPRELQRQESKEAQEARERQPREARESRPPREGREGNRQREPRENRESRQPREPREAKDGRNPGEGQQAREPRRQRQQQGNFDKKESRGSRFERQSKENREGRQSRVSRESEGQRQAGAAVRAEKAEISKKNKTFIAPQQNGS
ncbi:YutD family protein [Paenibacillus kribbensis]|uniref:YutD family protein n=1 Tax=Paenibacillus kribbensis TaxID=172713 RepID=UPI00083960A3|nr:YutD family protein [Paenibacillus kribbensis]